jgi:hypothetical protein
VYHVIAYGRHLGSSCGKGPQRVWARPNMNLLRMLNQEEKK